MKQTEDIQMLLEPYKSNFYMLISKSNTKFEREYIEHISVNTSKITKYNFDLGTTLLIILNNSEQIVNILSKYRTIFLTGSIKDFNQTLILLNDLMAEILKVNKYLHILIMDIEDLIFTINENKEVMGGDDLINTCLTCIFSLIETLQIGCTFALAPFFRTFNFSNQHTFHISELKGNKNLHKGAFETFRGNELYLPRVEIHYDNMTEDVYSTKKSRNRKNIIKKEIISYKYSIFSLIDLINTTLYHLQINDKAILCCSYCGKCFIPKKHQYCSYDEITGKEENHTIKEKNSRMTCSEECSNKMKKRQTKIKNSTGSKRELKNLRVKLSRIDNTYQIKLKEEFENRYCTFKNKLEEEFGKDNPEILEEKLLEFMLDEKEKMIEIRNKLKQQKK